MVNVDLAWIEEEKDVGLWGSVQEVSQWVWQGLLSWAPRAASGRDWSALPQDVVLLVAQRLCLRKDLVALARVCKAWHTILKEELSKRAEPLVLLWNDEIHCMHLFQSDKSWSPALRSFMPAGMHPPLLSYGPFLLRWCRGLFRCYNLITQTITQPRAAQHPARTPHSVALLTDDHNMPQRILSIFVDPSSSYPVTVTSHVTDLLDAEMPTSIRASHTCSPIWYRAYFKSRFFIISRRVGKLGIVRLTRNTLVGPFNPKSILDIKICSAHDDHSRVMPLHEWSHFFGLLAELDDRHWGRSRFWYSEPAPIVITLHQCNYLFIHMFCTLQSRLIAIIVYDADRDVRGVIPLLSMGKLQQPINPYFSLLVALDSVPARLALSSHKLSHHSNDYTWLAKHINSLWSLLCKSLPRTRSWLVKIMCRRLPQAIHNTKLADKGAMYVDLPY